MGEGRGGDKGDKGEQISTLIPQDKIDRSLLFPIPLTIPE